MAYKVNSTTVIDNNGNVDWARISNKPTIGSGDITNVSVSNGNPGGGPAGFPRDTRAYGNGNCNCTSNCVVHSLSGGGASGSVTVTGNRYAFNCNCNCRC